MKKFDLIPTYFLSSPSQHLPTWLRYWVGCLYRLGSELLIVITRVSPDAFTALQQHYRNS